MGLSRELWIHLSDRASAGRRAWSESRGSGGLERALWVAGTVFMAIPIFALLVVAVLGAAALTIAALLVGWLWSLMTRIGIIRSRRDGVVIRVSRAPADPSGAREGAV